MKVPIKVSKVFIKSVTDDFASIFHFSLTAISITNTDSWQFNHSFDLLICQDQWDNLSFKRIIIYKELIADNWQDLKFSGT